MSVRSTVRVALIAALLAPVLATADGSPGTTVKELSTLQSQVAVLKAKVQIAKLRAQLKKTQEGDTSSGSAPGLSNHERTAPPIYSAGHQNHAGGASLQVQSIEGRAKHLVATIQTASGGSMQVQNGSRLPGGARVIEVSANAVEIIHHGKRSVLPWATAPSTTQQRPHYNPSATGGLAGIPMGMTPPMGPGGPGGPGQ